MTNHAILKIEKRYNLELSFNDLENMMKIIQNGESICVGSGGGGKHFHYVKYNHIPFKVLYKKSKGVKTEPKIITVYPLDVDEYNKAVLQRKEDKIQGMIEYLKSNGYEAYKIGER